MGCKLDRDIHPVGGFLRGQQAHVSRDTALEVEAHRLTQGRYGGLFIDAVLGPIGHRQGAPQSSDASAPRCDDLGLPQSDVNDGHASPHSGMTMHFSVVLQLPDLPRSARSRGESYRRN
jgi:hypothetical protein